MEEKNILQYFVSVIKDNYANFEGRARRKEFWGFYLISTIISTVISAVSGGFSGDPGSIDIAGSIYSLAVLLPTLAVGVRRMHDVGKSGWYILIPIYNIILWFTDGDKGPNEYGPDPKNPDLNHEVDQIGEE